MRPFDPPRRPAQLTPGEEQPLAGGNTSAGVVRVGDTVRRPVGPWTQAVHALLRHLEEVGFPAAPRVLGIDDLGREVLTYVDGAVPAAPPWGTVACGDDALVAVGRTLRRYHDVVAAFRPPDDAVWRFATGTTGPAEVVCHNDVAPYNAAFRPDGSVVGLIDWDTAGPAAPAWDLAHAAWQFVPVMDDPTAAAHGWGPSPDRADRLRRLCDAYGLEGRDGFVALVGERIRATHDGIAGAAAAGDPVFVALTRFLPAMQASLRTLAEHGEDWQRGLR